MTELRERFGRPLRLGVIGGGPESWIGRMHRGAAEMDGWWRAVAGVFSSDAARSRAGGAALGFDPERSYGDRRRNAAPGTPASGWHRRSRDHDPQRYPLPIRGRRARRRSRCRLRQAGDARFSRGLRSGRAHQRGGRIFAVAHGYSAYPMTRYARQLVRDGVLGAVRLVQVEYIQSGMATRLEEGPQNNRLRWILDPRRSGLALVMSAIGCHAQHLASFITGLAVARVAADVGALIPGRKLIDYVSALLEFDGGARGTLPSPRRPPAGKTTSGCGSTATRACSTGRIASRAICARAAGRTRAHHRPWRYVSAAGDHRRGTYSARASRGAARGVRQYLRGGCAGPHGARPRRAGPDLPYPRIEDGAHTMAFIEACIASQASRGWVDVARLPAQ